MLRTIATLCPLEFFGLLFFSWIGCASAYIECRLTLQHAQLACAAIILSIQVDIYWIRKVATKLLRFFLCQCIPCDHYRSRQYRVLIDNSLLIDLPSKACSTLTASLALVSKYGIPPFDWQKVMALFEDIIRLFSSTSILLPNTTCTRDEQLGQAPTSSTHKREVLWISRTGLDQEFIPPAVEGVEALGVVDIVDQYTAVRAPVESHAQ